MPLSFLVPLFLAGLAALAVPVLLHLSRRHTAQPQEFPSLMFVQRLPQQSERRRRLRHLLLLCLRCTALALLAFAFARPFLDRPGTAVAAPSGSRELVVLLDRSASMGYGDRWQRAIEAARSAFTNLAPGDRATLLTFTDDAEVHLRSSRDPEMLQAALEELAPPAAARTRFSPGLRLAEGVLAASPLIRREVLLISDFQRSGWDGDPGTAGLRLPAGTVLTPVSVAEPSTSNLAVAKVKLGRQRQAGQERVTATARVVNLAKTPARDIPVTLEIDGRRIESRSLDLAPTAADTVVFTPFTVARANLRGSVRAGDDPLPADNRFHFTLSPGESLGVLLIEGADVPPDASLYLRHALALGQAPGFRLDVRRADELSVEDLRDPAVVVLHDASLPSGESGDRLREFVQQGGGLVVIAGSRAPARLEAGWIGSALTRGTTRNYSDGSALGFVDYSHPIFEPFAAPHNGNFSAARFDAARPLSTEGTARPLARLGDGTAVLVEFRVGEGRVLAWGSSIDQAWNDLALQPVFLPFVHRLVRYAADYSPPGAWRTVGEVLSTTRPGTAPALTWAQSPLGERIRLGDGIPLLLREPGFYELRSGTAGEALSHVLAVNLAPEESDLTAIDPEEIVNTLTSPGEAPAATAASTSAPALAARERQQNLWWYLLGAALVLFTAEAWLANRTSQYAR